VAFLNRVLPRANAMVARAPDLTRVASLMTTGQAVLAVMRPPEAEEIYRGAGRFAGMEGKSLRTLVAYDRHSLVTVDHFPRHHAWLLASAFTELNAVPRARIPVPDRGVPLHPGVLAFAHGETLESQE
jgi:hypothetical protein